MRVCVCVCVCESRVLCMSYRVGFLFFMTYRVFLCPTMPSLFSLNKIFLGTLSLRSMETRCKNGHQHHHLVLAAPGGADGSFQHLPVHGWRFEVLLYQACFTRAGGGGKGGLKEKRTFIVLFVVFVMTWSSRTLRMGPYTCGCFS